MGNVSLSLIVLKSGHLDALRSFYSSMGIQFVEEKHGTGPVHFAARIGDVVLELYPLGNASATADATTRLGFVVESLDRVLEAIKRADSQIVSEPQETEWGRRAVARDPDGRSVELYQR